MAYEYVELHDPPKWNITGPAPDGSALYDWWLYDCNDKVVLHKIVRTIKPRLGITDTRTLKEIKEKCCPKTLMREFIEAERFDPEKEDEIEEAMALSKKGYIGGVG